MTEKTITHVIRISHFERVPMGSSPECIKERTGKTVTCPGDALFAEVELAGKRFAVSIISEAQDDVTPTEFEGALRGMLGALLAYVDKPQIEGQQVVKIEGGETIQ